MSRRKAAKQSGKKKRKWFRKLLLLGGAAVAAYAIANRQRPGPCIPAGSPEERVMVKDEENLSGLGSIMQALITQLLASPAKQRQLDQLNLVLAIEPSEQPEIAITMTFSDGYVVIEPGVVCPDIHLVCDMETLLKMATIGAGLDAVKFMMSPEGQAMASKLFSGEMQIRGLASHPLAMFKFTQFLAPSPAQA